MSHAISIKNVSKFYGDYRAIKDISFDIQDNEFFTLLGPSGCGKTTLLRMIAGFEIPSGGVIKLHGTDIQSLPAHQRRVNTVFQNYALFPHMNLAQNIGFGLQMLKWSEEKIAARVDEMLELVHMRPFASRMPSALSGGQQQRIALARALAPQPEVLLLDEPLSALDLKLRQSMRDELQQLQRDTGITFIFVTHDQEEALAMSDRICVLAEGTIQQLSSPNEIYENPSNKFVADFIGETNFMPVTINCDDGETATITNPLGIELNVPNNGYSQGQEATMSLRPEKISINTPGLEVNLQGKIVHRTYMGGYTHYKVRTSNATELRVSKRNIISNDIKYSLNQQVDIGFSKASVRVLCQ
ncbi:MAG: ABC transporter ATP-binding protein [Colwellia sp.]|jgi:spermidine/putrescine ABC transporter ATP-binding subunit